MRVLVTGGSGFIGSHVVDKLREQGITVRVFDLRPLTHRTDVEFFPGTILDLEHLRLALDGVDAVMHLAAIADVRDALKDPYYAETVNVRGTITVLEAMRRAEVKQLVFGSSIWVYSDAEDEFVDERTPLRAPSHFYTATKIAGEHYCHSYSKLYGLEYRILRYGIPYGPRAWVGPAVSSFVERALRGESLTINGDGLQYRRFVYVEDLAEGNVLALKPIAKNKIYNLDGTEKVTIRQIAEAVQRILGNVRIEYGQARTGDFSSKEVSSKKAMEELGWRPRTTFEEGLKRYIDWCQRPHREHS